MMTLDDAWQWYSTTRAQLQMLGRLGRKYWNDLPWEGLLERDDTFKTRDAQVVVAESDFGQEHLDDFAVLILFSVFESIVRERVQSDVQKERDQLNHALVIRIVDEAIRDIEEGSFYRVIEIFKDRDAALVEEVNQVRRYRNWVAHGRRTKRPNSVDPNMAYHRLKRFLDRL